MRLDDFLSRLEGVKRQGHNHLARCPAHHDAKASLSVAEGDKGIVLTCFAGCPAESVVERMGLTMSDLFYEERTDAPVDSWGYVDETSRPLYEVVRKTGKRFLQRQSLPGHPDADEDGWVWSLGREASEGKHAVPYVRRVPYRLPEVLARVAERGWVWVCEGEGDVETLRKLGEVATCNSGGAGKWQHEWGGFFTGSKVVIVADKDEPGLNHAKEVAASMAAFEAKKVVIVQAKVGKDTTDHIKAGLGIKEFAIHEVVVSDDFEIVWSQEFISVKDELAIPLMGSLPNDVVLPAGGWLLMYGDPGSSKTTLTLDAVAHMAAGKDWHGIPVPKPVRVLLVENEGPRAFFRSKVERKFAQWENGVRRNIAIYNDPWGRLSLASERHREKLAGFIRKHDIDLVVAGPLKHLGAPGAGSPEEVVKFSASLTDLQEKVGRPVALWIVHHTNVRGEMSGAWGGETDTTMAVRMSQDATVIKWKKTRWSSKKHGKSRTLAWDRETEGFRLIEDEDGCQSLVQDNLTNADWTQEYHDYMEAVDG